MKTQILRLDMHDDATSIRDKMGWGQPGRILIIWPEQGRVPLRHLDLLLILRHSSRLGAQLALATRDPEVRSNAADLAIPVFRDLRQAQRSQWRVGRRRPRRPPFELPPPAPLPDLRGQRSEYRQMQATWPNHPAFRAVFFILGVLGVLSIAAASFPGALIELSPQTHQQQVRLEVHADPDLNAVNLTGGIPARTLRVTVEGRNRLQSQGHTRLSQMPASGRVTFTNLTGERQAIPAGTVVRTGGEPAFRFATTRGGTAPAGVGQTVSLPVQALFPGPDGNLPAGALAAIEGPLGLRLTASNLSPTRGGTEMLVPVPTDLDRQRVYTQLESELRQTALSELELQIEPQDLLFTSTLTLTQVLESTYLPPEGQPGDFIELSLRLEYQALSATTQDLHTLAVALLDANLPDNYAALEHTLQVETLEPAMLREDLPYWTVRLYRNAQANIPAQQAISLVLGQPVRAAGQRLRSGLPLANEPRLHLAPEWWPFLPLLPFRISVSFGD